MPKEDPGGYQQRLGSPTGGYDRRSVENISNLSLNPGALGGASGYGFGGPPPSASIDYEPFQGTFNPFTGEYER